MCSQAPFNVGRRDHAGRRRALLHPPERAHYTPFGLGKLEVAFETIHEFLCAHRFASRLASNSVVQYALWLQNLSPQHHERLIRWWQDEIEGTGKVPILTVENKPEVLRFAGGTDADLRLQWQEFLIRIIADAFDLPPMCWAWSATLIATPLPRSMTTPFAPRLCQWRASLPNT